MAQVPRVITVTVTTAGTQVRVITDQADPQRYVPWAYFEASKDNAGLAFIGDANVAATNYSACLDATGATTPAGINWSLAQMPRDADLNLFDLYNTWVDAATSGDKVFVTVGA